MKTPYCTSAKLAVRSLDEVRSRIGEVQEEIASLNGRAAVLRAIVAAERSAQAADMKLPETRWFARTAADQHAVAERRATLEEELATLREEASALLGSQRALEEAQRRYRADHARTLGRREQASADDRAAALFRSRVCSGGRRA